MLNNNNNFKSVKSIKSIDSFFKIKSIFNRINNFFIILGVKINVSY